MPAVGKFGKRFLSVLVTVALTAGLLTALPVGSAAATPGEAGSEQAGSSSVMAEARASGHRVEDVSQRDEVTQVFANPDGTWTAEVAPEAVRAKGLDGKWGDIDTDLEVRDGAVVPRLAASNVRFSAGADHTFAAMTVERRTLEWRWPGILPEPVLDGDTATYPEAVAGGDLVVTATAEGFSHSVVLRERPEGPVDFGIEVVTPGADLVRVPEGGLEVQTPAGKSVVQAPAPLMWDSSENVVGDPEVKSVETRVDRVRAGVSTVILSPDEAFLSDPDTVYPVTIDPTITPKASGDTWLQKSSHTSSMGGSIELRAGTYDGGAHIARSFINFSSSSWSGREVLSATLKLRNWHSTNCTGANIRVARITKSWVQSKLTWANQPPASTATGDVDDFFQAYGASGCPTADANWNVTSIVKKWASGTAPNYGFKVFAKDETKNASWRKYRSANYDTTGVRPRLVIDYNTAPATPYELAISPCVGTCSPRVTDSLTPTLSGRAKDVDGDQLTYTFQVAPAASTTPIATGTVGPVTQNTKVSWQVPAGKLADDTSYQWRLGAKDARTTTWSSWVGFSVGADRPPAEPSHLSVYPCEGECTSLVSTSLNPDLTAVVTDPDSESVDAQFEVREQGTTEVMTSGSDLVTSGGTARFTLEPGILEDGGSYQFQVTAKDAESQTASPWTDFTAKVDTSAPGSSLRLAEPLVVWDQGPELAWTHYKDPSGAEGDDLVEYQIFRGCTALPGTEGCSTPVGPDYTTAPNSGLELVGTVDRDQNLWTDESAEPSAANEDATYYYWVGARTRDDVAHSRVAQVASASQPVTTPRQGRVRRIFTGDPADPSTVLDDVTISNAPTHITASLDSPEDAAGTAGKWIQVGNSHPKYGLERALLAFDLDAIDVGLTVTDARVELHQVGGGGSGATVELRELSKSFNETEANWTNAQSTVLWTTPGGDMKPGPLATVSTDNTPKTLTLAGSTAQTVQGWVNNRTSNHGFALATTSQTSQQWLNLASSEAADAATRPRLVVEHLKTADTDTIVAPETPERILPQTVTTVPVTVTNTTAETWPADMELTYRWTLPGGTVDESTANTDRYKPLGRALAPGESVQVGLTLRAPIQSGSGEKQKEYDLFLDLMSPRGVWWSATHDYVDPEDVLTDSEREQRLCTMVADGLLCPDRLVDDAPSSMIGLEQYLSYAGEETGAGSQVLTNLSTGNVVWSYDGMQNPSVGPSMFTRVIYNSLDTGDPGTGHDWSVQVGTLNRLGTPLESTANDTVVTLVDGDGTSHVWYQDPEKTTATAYGYQRPAGVNLELTARKDPNDATKVVEWEFGRPDGTTFLYRRHTPSGKILPVSVTDTNDNALTFQHSANNKANLESLTDAKGRVVAELGWNSAGLAYVKDISNRALKFTYNSAHQLTKLEDGGGFNTVEGTFADTTEVKTFAFAWTTTQQSSGTRLAQVTDPLGASTDLDYFVSNETYPVPYQDHTLPSSVTGWPKTLTDRMDRATTFRYYVADSSDNDIRTDVTDTNPQDPADDETTTYLIDGYGRTIEVKDANANAEAKPHVTRLGWDADHNVTRMTEPNGATSRWQYDNDTGYPLRIWDAQAVKDGGDPQTLCYGPPTGPVPQNCLGVAGQLTVLRSITSAGGMETTFGYDTRANLTSVTDPMGHTTRYTYNPDGTQATAADARQENPLAEPDQYVTTLEYDPAYGAKTGYPTRIAPPAGIAATDFAYDPRGNVTSTTQVGENATLTTTADYDAFGRPTRVEAPGAQGGRRIAETNYDLNDNVTATTAPNKAVTSLAYTADDQLKTATLPSNGGTGPRVETSTYDVMGRLDTVTTPEGNLTAEADDHVTRYDYDHLGQVLQVEQPLAGPNGETAVTSFSYDTVGNVIEVRDPRGNTSRMVYDLNGQQTAAIDPAGFSTRTRYGADGEVLTEIDQRGVPKTYDYYRNGLLKTIAVLHTPTGRTQETWVTEYEYDEVGNQTKVIRPHEKTAPAAPLFEETSYDANNLVTERRAAFDPNHANTGYREPAVSYFRYDNLGRMIQQSAPTRDGEDTADWTDFTHYASGEIETSTDPWSISTSYEYNKLGLQTRRVLTSASGAANRTMTWEYHPDGSLAARDDVAAPTAATMVDNSDATQVRSTGTWDTGTSSTSKVGADYRTHPAAAAGTSAAGDQWTWDLAPAEDGTYRVEVSCPAVEDATTTASYTVDADQVHTPPALNQTRCSDDRTWHRLGSFQFTGGQPASVSLAVSADGSVVADAVRLVKVDNERSFTYEYDADGRQKTVKNQTTGASIDTYTTTYDAVGQVSQVQELAGTEARRTTTYEHDLSGNVASVLANRGPAPGAGDEGNLEASRYTKYTWDERDLVATVTAGRNALDLNRRTWAYTYDPRGMKATWTKPAADGTATGNVTTYAYHESGLLRSMVERRPDAGHTLVASHQLWFNPDGDRTRDISRVDNATPAAVKPNLEQTADYTYTPERRLAKVEKSGTNKSKNEIYLYDAAGNVDEQTVDGNTTDFEYDRNRLVTSTTTGVQSTYQYDPFGRLESVSAAGQVINSYRYDGFDRAVEEKETLPGKPTVVKTSAYDPFDRTSLQVKTIGTQAPKKTRFNYLGTTDQVAVEEKPDESGAWQVAKTYSYGPDGRPLDLEDTPVTGTEPDKTHFYSVNPHGDTEALTDPTTGQTTATYRYTAYGSADKTGTTGADQLSDDPAQEEDLLNPYRFNSKRYDGATGDYDMGFRNYDPGLNRFLTRDMYNGALNDLALGTDPWHTNRYAFAGGNPITRIELDGHVLIEDWDPNYSGGSSEAKQSSTAAAEPTEREISETYSELYEEFLPDEVAADFKETEVELADDPDRLAEHRRWFLASLENAPEDKCVDHWWCAPLTDPDVQAGVTSLSIGGLGGLSVKLSLARRGATVAAATTVTKTAITRPNSGIYIINSSKGIYVGQSGNITKRLARHVRTGKFTQAEVNNAARQAVSGGKLQREIAEQTMIDRMSGINNLLNVINPIGPRRFHFMPNQPYFR